MAKLLGTWKLASSENFDEYMKAAGVGFLMRKMGNAAKPNVIITQDGDNWHMKSVSTLKTVDVAFKLGEEFEETTADGRKMKTTMTVEGDNKLVQTQKGDIDSTLTRTVGDDGKMTLTCSAKDVVSTRVYTKEA